MEEFLEESFRLKDTILENMVLEDKESEEIEAMSKLLDTKLKEGKGKLEEFFKAA